MINGSVEGQGETILVVEDDTQVRATAVEMLDDLGYDVLKATDGESALAVIQSGVHIDLLFTDVVMPGPIRSTDLAQRAQAHLPDLEVLFTSGYTESAIVHQGRLESGVSLLSKPYTREELARKIRETLQLRDDRAGQDGAQTGGKAHTDEGDAHARAAESPSTSNGRIEAQKESDAGEAQRTDSWLRILLVEDEAFVRRLACEAIQELGHHVDAVADADAAIEAFEEDDFDVLFTDVSLPGISGVALARKLKNRSPELKVVLASGYGSSVDIAGDGKLEGAVPFPKPYSLSDIEEVLNQLMNDPES